jgi:uncharacterized membrane protein
MTTNSAPDTGRKQRWLVPILSLVAGLGYVVIFLIRHDPWFAAFGFAVMAVYALILVLTSRRFETAALLRGELTDERRRDINRRASTFTLNLLILVMLTAMVISLLQGHDAGDWSLMCAVAGATYLLSIAYYTRRG